MPIAAKARKSRASRARKRELIRGDRRKRRRKIRVRVRRAPGRDQRAEKEA